MRVLAPATAVLVLLISASTALAAPGAHANATRRIVVRPVTSAGRPAAGYTTQADKHLSVDCSGGSASPAAVDPGIAICSPSAAYVPACWKSAQPHHVLCLRDARKHTLVRLERTGAFAAGKPPKRPTPMDLLLGDRRACELRIGGTSPTLPHHPDYVVSYYCTHNSAVWTREQSRSSGINRSRAAWTVGVAPTDSKTGKLSTKRVAKAYFVGTAR